MAPLKHPGLGALMALVLVCAFLLLPSGVMAASGGQQEDSGEKRCPTVHKIALGENLTTIAAQYEVTVEALIEENGIEDANLIVENQALCIPARERSGNSSGTSEWSTYGVPGKAYDPSAISKQSSGGPQAESYGNQGGWQPEGGYGVPGKAYDPQSQQPNGYWKDDLRYPRPYSLDAEGEEPPYNGENGENGTQVN